MAAITGLNICMETGPKTAQYIANKDTISGFLETGKWSESYGAPGYGLPLHARIVAESLLVHIKVRLVVTKLCRKIRVIRALKSTTISHSAPEIKSLSCGIPIDSIPRVFTSAERPHLDIRRIAKAHSRLSSKPRLILTVRPEPTGRHRDRGLVVRERTRRTPWSKA